MRAVIIGNGEIRDYTYIKSLIKPDDFVICADGGLRHAKMLGISPDIAVGDFDSYEKSENIESIVYPSHKNLTDGEIAVDYAIENGYSDILMLAMTGTRLDHTFTNIFQLAKKGNITLIDDDNEVYFIKDKLILNGKKGKTISIIPVFSDLVGVTATGVYYPLDNDTLLFGEGRGNSNIITDDICTVSVKDGMGIIFINNGE